MKIPVAQRVRDKLLKAAEAPEFQAIVKKLSREVRCPPRPLLTTIDIVPTGGIYFVVSHQMGEKLLKKYQRALVKQGLFLCRYMNMLGISIGRKQMKDMIALLPTTDKYEVLLAMETTGGKSGLGNAAIIKWLKAMEKTHPFDLAEAGSRFLVGNFRKPVKNPGDLAKKIAKFCPPSISNIAALERITRQVSQGKLCLQWE